MTTATDHNDILWRRAPVDWSVGEPAPDWTDADFARIAAEQERRRDDHEYGPDFHENPGRRRRYDALDSLDYEADRDRYG